MDEEAARLAGALRRSGAAWKAIALQQSMSRANMVLSAAMAGQCEGKSWVVRSGGVFTADPKILVRFRD